jgi:hypothetical protein
MLFFRLGCHEEVMRVRPPSRDSFQMCFPWDLQNRAMSGRGNRSSRASQLVSPGYPRFQPAKAVHREARRHWFTEEARARSDEGSIAFRRIEQRLPRRNLFLKRKLSVAKEKIEPVGNGNEFCENAIKGEARSEQRTV